MLWKAKALLDIHVQGIHVTVHVTLHFQDIHDLKVWASTQAKVLLIN